MQNHSQNINKNIIACESDASQIRRIFGTVFCDAPYELGRELNSEGQLIPPKWDDIDVSTDPVESGDDDPNDFASSSCYCKEWILVIHAL